MNLQSLYQRIRREANSHQVCQAVCFYDIWQGLFGGLYRQNPQDWQRDGSHTCSETPPLPCRRSLRWADVTKAGYATADLKAYPPALSKTIVAAFTDFFLSDELYMQEPVLFPIDLASWIYELRRAKRDCSARSQLC